MLNHYRAIAEAEPPPSSTRPPLSHLKPQLNHHRATTEPRMTTVRTQIISFFFFQKLFYINIFML